MSEEPTHGRHITEPIIVVVMTVLLIAVLTLALSSAIWVIVQIWEAILK